MGPTKLEMLERQLKGRGITDPQVLQAMEKTDRTLFIPPDKIDEAYKDGPLSIGEGQTISQPYIVAYMAQVLDLNEEDKVLEVGAGCGYNAAVLSQIASSIYSVEIVEWLANFAKSNLLKADIRNVSVKHGDGYQGWQEHAPFDAIVLTAAPKEIPSPLKQQLTIGGKLLAPVGTTIQKLLLIKRESETEFSEEELLPVKFVPMTGKAQQ